MIKIKRGVFIIPVTYKDSIRKSMEKSGVKDGKVIKLIYKFSEITSALAKDLSKSRSKRTALISLKELVLSECPKFDFERDYLLVIKRKKSKSKK